jgi:hypothetical protein
VLSQARPQPGGDVDGLGRFAVRDGLGQDAEAGPGQRPADRPGDLAQAYRVDDDDGPGFLRDQAG